mmetsp:Transcript_60609/g.126900  ORF Transcript_60609/g.126900 Transcript_60609/m.126900 type:complete len:208 (-) Transcript_60609:918-1541(-)
MSTKLSLMASSLSRTKPSAAPPSCTAYAPKASIAEHTTPRQLALQVRRPLLWWTVARRPRTDRAQTAPPRPPIVLGSHCSSPDACWTAGRKARAMMPMPSAALTRLDARSVRRAVQSYPRIAAPLRAQRTLSAAAATQMPPTVRAFVQARRSASETGMGPMRGRGALELTASSSASAYTMYSVALSAKAKHSSAANTSPAEEMRMAT